MRVYVPLTLPALSEAHGAGELGPAPVEAYAVTPGLRAWWGSEDAEELEYAALRQAAGASLRLLADQYEAARRRVVVALEAADGAVVPDEEDDGSRGGAEADAGAVGRVRLTAAVPLTEAAAVHLDAEDAVDDVTAAVGALSAALAGDERAEQVVDRADDHELLWFATQEIPALVG
ncbi:MULTISPECIES: DUF6912 family protein [Streptomyces]|uniref:Uncharacterized protein n=1 Tax=Streptomyces qinglanensis TaxID=943816 RepID=A0A1E7K0R2_9ACTN|nr:MULTISPECIES: hypothetical protein [Streptomyces]OEU97509.1 hypothetical protein AN217_06090 [Streptomyces qinglanensis]